MSPPEWAKANRRYPETSGVPGPRDPYLTPYMVPLTEAAAKGGYKRFVAVTAAQSGKTDSILDLIGARLDQKPVPIIYVGPTKEFLTDQLEPRLMSLLDEAPTLARKLERGKRMKKTLKRIAGVRLRLAHAGSSSALKSDPAAMAFVDEYDEMTRSVKGQGDVLGLLEARGITYADFVTIVTSTPSVGSVETVRDETSGLEFWKTTDPGDIKSPIWSLWQEGTMHHWAWPCQHCEQYFIPRFTLLRWPEKVEPAEAAARTELQCPHCGGLHNDTEHKFKMNSQGRMVAPGQRILPTGEVVGEPRRTSTWSCWSSGLTSPFVSWGDRIEKYLVSLNAAEPNKVQTAMNAQMGELFNPAMGSDKPDWKELWDRRLPYKRGDVPPDVLRVAMGVDVQRESLIYGVRGFGARGTSWLIDEGELFGSTSDDAVWEDLVNVMTGTYGQEQIGIEKVFIDSGFRPDKAQAGDEHKVYEFCRRWNWLCKPTKGVDTASSPLVMSKIEVTAKGKKATYSIDLVRVNTDFFKSLLFSRIKTPVNLPGAFFVHSEVSEDYCRQVVSEARTINENGKPEWIRSSRRNHFLDVEALLAAAAFTMNVQRIPEGVSRSVPLQHGATSTEEVPSPNDAAAKQTAMAPKISLRNRFASASRMMNR